MIRRASVEDIAAIAALSTQLGGDLEPQQWTARLQRLLDHASHAVFVSQADDRPVGGALAGFAAAEHRLLLQSGEWVELVALAVDADARRGGIGAMLVAAVEAWSARRGVDRVVVRSNVTREDAHPFYRALGYETLKTQHVYGKRLR